ncbi:type II toxin-antitoxin system RelE/ParE family toxin [Marinilactibacillus psychrotolerans]|uniref:type II toxin-antitoxin system RelE/ParE family toxin n=1 Tax=Marinilactibacillus psychrotolerans TaxID=191770 RepID=UPI00382A5004
MNIVYKNDKVEEQCTKLKIAKKKFPEKVANKLFKLINFIEAADNLYSITSFQPYHFHNLKGKKDGFYSIDIDGRKSSYRLIVTFNDEDLSKVFSDGKSIEVIKIEEVSKHHE